MATLNMACDDLVYNMPIENRLGDYGVAFPVGMVLWIDTDDVVYVTQSMTQDQIDGTNGVTGAKAGSGDFGLAIFRRGLTYTITAGEETLIDAAGFGDCIS